MANKDFFLSPDDAQTLGDINYMRKSVRVRHTFPKSLKNPDGFEVVKEVSSSEDRNVNNLNENRTASYSTQSTTTSSFSSSSAQSSTQSRTTDTSIDMFRNMARKIGKRK